MALVETQKARGKQPLNLVQDCPTRWNSSLYMIQRLLELSDELTVVCHGGRYDGKVVLPEKERATVWPTDHQWKVSSKY